VLTGCGRSASKSGSGRQRTIAQAVEQTSVSCQNCHTGQFALWSGTDHALANRRIDPVRDEPVFRAKKSIADGGSRFELSWENGRPTMVPPSAAASPATALVKASPDLVLGNKPLWQPLLPAAGGRWQPTDLAFDPSRQEWFNIFGKDNRQPGEWGHWTGRGMNWNSMCAQCHMTGYQKNYDTTSDSYSSTWVEHGIGCIQCHGPMVDTHHDRNANKGSTRPPFHGDRQRMMQTCAPCHARNEALTADFQPGDNYHDHYRVTLPVDATVFYPDGQQRDEDFNWTSVLLSRMGHAGVTCLDCHDPHSNKTILPASDNQLCLQCHAAPGRLQPNGTRAVPIDPLAHSHHAAGSTGSQCISCHMPTTTYMQRSPRHDHGWIRPDPLLTKELGIPNACNRCHTDKPVDWAIQSTDAWFGAKLDSHQRTRTRAVAAAQAQQPDAPTAVLAALGNEAVPAWRATLLDLLVPFGPTEPIVAAAQTALAARDPLERSAAVRLLSGHAPSHDRLQSLLTDPVRVVRLDAAWALSPELPENSPVRRELDAYFSLSLDQPGGQLRLGQDLANRRQYAAAEKAMKLALQWDPNSPGIYDALGFVLNAQGSAQAAAAAFFRAAQLQSSDAPAAYRAALAFAEARQPADAEMAFRLAVERNPRFDRAWYNLGLLLAETNRLADAIDALRRAETIAPTAADYPYALATIFLRNGDRAGAEAAARRALVADPAHAGARQLLNSR
jgi:predicted CXXCH cytochrome family protein